MRRPGRSRTSAKSVAVTIVIGAGFGAGPRWLLRASTSRVVLAALRTRSAGPLRACPSPRTHRGPPSSGRPSTVPAQPSGGCEIRTRGGLPPTRFQAASALPALVTQPEARRLSTGRALASERSAVELVVLACDLAAAFGRSTQPTTTRSQKSRLMGGSRTRPPPAAYSGK